MRLVCDLELILCLTTTIGNGIINICRYGYLSLTSAMLNRDNVEYEWKSAKGGEEDLAGYLIFNTCID